jgi:hypothetical protein
MLLYGMGRVREGSDGEKRCVVGVHFFSFCFSYSFIVSK